MGEGKQGEVYVSADGEHWERVGEEGSDQQKVEANTPEVLLAQLKEVAGQVSDIIREFFEGVKAGYAPPKPELEDAADTVDSTAHILD